jgi:flavin reductase (DIM6/NTAB) family NADH-FMN oxidoreductase RutF
MTSRGKPSTTDGNLGDDFRAAWSRFATGVTVITTLEPGGAVHGMTANGVTSVSLTPPLALLCVGHDRNTYRLIQQTGQQGAASYYAQPPERRDPSTRFDLDRLGGSHVLRGALAAMDCRIVAAHEAGDHTIFIAEVEHVGLGDGAPLIWHKREFARLCDQTYSKTLVDGRLQEQ